MTSQPRLSAPGFNLTDPIFLRSFDAEGMMPITSYLLALAAFRRGLSVTFLRNVEPGKAAPGFGADSERAELFCVSDGTKEVVFSRSLTNLVDPRAIACASDKAMTKDILRRAHLRAPAGITLDRDDQAAARAFLSSSKADRFVVKPVASSLGKGVVVNLAADEVLEQMRLSPPGRLLIEEYITGTELRVAVVGDRVVGALILHPANVIGDGVHTIEELASLKTVERLKNPALRSIDGGIYLDDEKRSFLAGAGRTVSDIPAKGEKVVLSRYRSMMRGGETESALNRMNDSLKQVCVAAARAIRLPLAGIDLILSDRPETPGAFILEVNARPHLSAHLMPTIGQSCGMALPDAVINLHFPQSRAGRGHGDAVFDYVAVRDAMRSTAAERIALPQLSQDWQHLIVQFRSVQIRDFIMRLMRLAGATVMTAASADGQTHFLDVLLDPRTRMFLQQDRAKIKTLVPELEAAITWPDADEARKAFRAEAVEAAKLRNG